MASEASTSIPGWLLAQPRRRAPGGSRGGRRACTRAAACRARRGRRARRWRTPPRRPAARAAPSASSRRPASVSSTLRVVRTNSSTPSSASSCRIAWLTRRGGHVQPVGRAREAQLLGDRDEVAQVAQLGHRRPIMTRGVVIAHGSRLSPSRPRPYRPAHDHRPPPRHGQRPPRARPPRRAGLLRAAARHVLLGRVDGVLRAALSCATAASSPTRSPAPPTRPAAARVDVLILNRAEVEALLDLGALLDGPARRLRRADQPARSPRPGRNELTMPDEAFLLGMPGRLRDGAMTVKIVTVFESPRLRATWRRSGSTTRTPAPAARSWTAPTSPRSARARRPRSPPTCSRARTRATLAIIGAGVQGEHHLRTFPLVRDFDEIRDQLALRRGRAPAGGAAPARAGGGRSRGRRPRRGRGRAGHARRAAGDRAGLDRARHPRQLGRLPAARRRAAARAAATASLFVETREAFEPTPVGCAELAGATASATELGEVLLGRKPGPHDARRDHRLQGDGPRRRGHRRRRAGLRGGPRDPCGDGWSNCRVGGCAGHSPSA